MLRERFYIIHVPRTEKCKMQNTKNLNSSDDDWQVNTRSVSERGKYLLENPVWTDCRFLVGTEESHVREFEAHKLILSMTSPVFATMFNGGLPETKCPIKIVDVQPEAFHSMLEYIYTDTITLDSLDQACELCYVAKKYMLPHLLKKSVEFIWKDVDCDTALTAYEFAKLFDDPGILEKSMTIISERTTDVLSKGSVLNMSEETLLDILDQDELNVPSEIYLFNVVQSWVLFNVNRTETEKFEADKVRKFAKSAVRKIRFLTMSVSDFAEGPAQSQIITKDESFAILLNISSAQTKYPMPEDFSTSRTPRNNPLHKITRVSRKLYLQRPIKDSTVQFNVGSLTDTVHFISNDNVTLIGIQIPTQIAHAAIDTAPSREDEDNIDHERSTELESQPLRMQTKYREYLIMFVKEAENPENSWSTHFTSLVDHNSIANIMLTTPVTIKRGYEYELEVTLIKRGYYLIGYFERVMEKYSGNIKFILSGHTDTAFISSLIYIH